jgi:hypothetical protein
MKKKFKWLGLPGIPRRGPSLRTGDVYSVADFPAGVVEEWVRTGSAQFLGDDVTKTEGENVARKPPRENGGK